MIYICMANGTEEIEALTPADVLRRAGFSVRTIGINGKTVTGSHNIPLVCDCTPEQAPVEDMDMIVLPGGMPGTRELDASPHVRRYVEYALEHDKWIAAICAAPVILGHMGILRGRRAVCFPGFENELEGAKLQDAYVCTDGKIITGRGMGAALPFSLKLLECLSDEATAAAMAKNLQCSR